jgi:hypothetical protein
MKGWFVWISSPIWVFSDSVSRVDSCIWYLSYIGQEHSIEFKSSLLYLKLCFEKLPDPLRITSWHPPYLNKTPITTFRRLHRSYYKLR